MLVRGSDADVMGPDEYAYPVNNSAYTNAAATIALLFAAEARLAPHANLSVTTQNDPFLA